MKLLCCLKDLSTQCNDKLVCCKLNATTMQSNWRYIIKFSGGTPPVPGLFWKYCLSVGCIRVNKFIPAVPGHKSVLFYPFSLPERKKVPHLTYLFNTYSCTMWSNYVKLIFCYFQKTKDFEILATYQIIFGFLQKIRVLFNHVYCIKQW